MDDLYNDVMLRRWSLDMNSGQLECFDDAADIRLISADDREAIEAKNAELHGVMEAVETYEAEQPEEADTDIIALAAIRRGEATEEQITLVLNTWGDRVVITEPTPAQIAREALPALERWQFLAVLDLAELAPSIEKAIAAIADPIDRVVAQRRYESSTSYRRIDPLFEGLRSMVGITEDQVDDLWAYAGTLKAGS